MLEGIKRDADPDQEDQAVHDRVVSAGLQRPRGEDDDPQHRQASGNQALDCAGVERRDHRNCRDGGSVGLAVGELTSSA